jgi:hypothetical protein
MFISTRQFKIPSLCLSNNKSILTVRFRVWLVTNPSIPILILIVATWMWRF